VTLTRASLPGRWANVHHSIDTITGGFNEIPNPVDNTSAWGVANRAIYMPVRVTARVIIKKLGCVTSTTGAGNIDIGIYDAGGTRLISTGSTAKSAVASTQIIDVTDTTIGPGLYYLALNNSTTTDTFVAAVGMAQGVPSSMGLRSEAVGAVTLPATATWAVANTIQFVPAIVAFTVSDLTT
jgi:hypothetical protein